MSACAELAGRRGGRSRWTWPPPSWSLFARTLVQDLCTHLLGKARVGPSGMLEAVFLFEADLVDNERTNLRLGAIAGRDEDHGRRDRREGGEIQCTGS